MTADEWARAYAERGGTTVQRLRQLGREVRPCDCGLESCEGWQMAHIKEDSWYRVVTTQNSALRLWRRVVHRLRYKEWAFE